MNYAKLHEVCVHWLRSLLLFAAIHGVSHPLRGQDSLCVRVKIEIEQSVTLERQSL